VRTLTKEPGFTFAAVATLALGIACSATMFSVLDAVLLEPVPHADSARVLAAMLPGVRPTDAWGYASAAFAIALVTLLAAIAPAWRAARIDPAVALRGE
jgi:ABC-type antimicrobial peptide transport system permease subunit